MSKATKEVFIVIRCCGETTRIEKVFKDKKTAKFYVELCKLKHTYTETISTNNVNTFHIVTKKLVRFVYAGEIS